MEPSDRLRAAVGTATRAPSAHNTQPWSFRLGDTDVELWADRTRSLPIVDPDDRELHISCGAALHHLRVALAAAGVATRTEVSPEPLLPDLLARVTAIGAAPPPALAVRWRESMPNRHTVRAPFAKRLPSIELVQALAIAASAEGAALRVLRDDERPRLIDLIQRADRQQSADRDLRRELATWLRGNRRRGDDGIPADALGWPGIEGAFARFAVRRFDWGRAQAARDSDLAARAPVLAIVETGGDDPRAWIAAGQALSAVLLEATASGLAASFFNQPVEVPALRRELGAGAAAPQLVLRLGYFRGLAVTTPRRPLDDLWI
jgi:hypothetical protein